MDSISTFIDPYGNYSMKITLESIEDLSCPIDQIVEQKYPSIRSIWVFDNGNILNSNLSGTVRFLDSIGRINIPGNIFIGITMNMINGGFSVRKILNADSKLHIKNPGLFPNYRLIKSDSKIKFVLWVGNEMYEYGLEKIYFPKDGIIVIYVEDEEYCDDKISIKNLPNLLNSNSMFVDYDDILLIPNSYSIYAHLCTCVCDNGFPVRVTHPMRG